MLLLPCLFASLLFLPIQEKKNTPQPPTLTWDSLEARMKREAEQGFAGVVLVVRQGELVHHEGYGLANREKNIAMKPDTILAIGSTPIDFTSAGILLLAERGKLSLSDPITKHLKNVPDDKKTITLEHLMSGKSGLLDFHDVRADQDKDHSWIDRDEAVRRILGSRLLFEPGKSRRHSHSAFGLLAAILEIVSGQTYQDFTREHLFKPAGMKDTGFFGEKYNVERMAIGYGIRKDGEMNAPPFWGKTSWLVMGSGGQVSTAEDMWKWIKAVKGGKILNKESMKHFTGAGDGMLTGGDMYGFEIIYAGNPQSFFLVMSNTGSPRRMPQLRTLGQDLMALVLNRRPGKYTLGLQFEVDEGQPVKLVMVVPGGPADRAGLKPGDLILKAGGIALTDDPGPVFSKLLQNDDEIEFEIQRVREKRLVKVKPTLRGN